MFFPVLYNRLSVIFMGRVGSTRERIRGMLPLGNLRKKPESDQQKSSQRFEFNLFAGVQIIFSAFKRKPLSAMVKECRFSSPLIFFSHLVLRDCQLPRSLDYQAEQKTDDNFGGNTTTDYVCAERERLWMIYHRKLA